MTWQCVFGHGACSVSFLHGIGLPQSLAMLCMSNNMLLPVFDYKEMSQEGNVQVTHDIFK
jgi:hypothetical protein